MSFEKAMEEELRLIMRSYEELTGSYWLPIEVKEQKMFILGWQASRAAIEVKLPGKETSWRTDNWAQGFNEGVKRCGKNIESLGLKVKP